jgi:CRISPR-associated DxTHG motif protein
MQAHLLSFLGTSNYKSCTYSSDEFHYQSRFSSIAIAQLIRENTAQPKKPLKTTIFTTPTAAKLNQAQLLGESPQPQNIEFVKIPEGGDEHNYWKIFEAINDAVSDEDTIWLDITHSFRYLPMLAYAVLQYLQDVRGIEVKGIYYGAAETLGPLDSWPEASEERLVPLHDLTPFLQVNQWSHALRTFHESGSAKQIRQLTDAKALPRIKKSKGKDDQAKALKQLGIALETWSQQVNTCRGQGIFETNIGERIHIFIERIGSEMLPPLAREFDQLRQRFAAVRKGQIQNIFIAAQWCAEKGLTQQTWTLLQEGIVTYHAQLWEVPLNDAFPLPQKTKHSPDILKRNLVERRNFVSQLFQVSAYNIPVRDWKDPIGKFPQLAKALQGQITAGLPELFAEISADRNDINHAGFDQNAADHVKITKRSIEKITQIRKCLPDAFTQPSQTPCLPHTSPPAV